MKLADWLTYLETLHPCEIDLGLQRVKMIAQRLELLNPACKVITVAGTNGKGSCVALLDAILRAEGYRIGCYTSPHLLHFNERIVINHQPVDGQSLCNAFAAIEQKRLDPSAANKEISLTYFEFATLAALYLFKQQTLDFILLEVGLGGRLDAVNIIDADLAILSTIDLDHQDWLGNSREQIGFEKAGILRRHKIAVCGDPSPPQSVMDFAQAWPCTLLIQGQDFSASTESEGESAGLQWTWRGLDHRGTAIKLTQLPRPSLLLQNAATVLQSLMVLNLPLSEQAIKRGLQNASLPARQQTIRVIGHKPDIILDVAHNPQAAAKLAQKLHGEDSPGKTHLVLAMLAEKDSASFCEILSPYIDCWHITKMNQERGLAADLLYNQTLKLLAMKNGGAGQRTCNRFSAPPRVSRYANIRQAWQAATQQSSADDRIVVTGSFYTVAEVMDLTGLLTQKHEPKSMNPTA